MSMSNLLILPVGVNVDNFVNVKNETSETNQLSMSFFSLSMSLIFHLSMSFFDIVIFKGK